MKEGWIERRMMLRSSEVSLYFAFTVPMQSTRRGTSGTSITPGVYYILVQSIISL